MLKLLSRRTCLKKYPLFPRCSPRINRFFFPETIDGCILTVSTKARAAHTKQLAIEICQLLDKLEIDSIICLADTPCAWRAQDHDHKPVVRALDYLAENGISETFDGAIEVSLQELQKFIVHLYWLQSCCTALPDFHLMDKGQSIVGHICKYGNLHLGIISEDVANSIDGHLANTKLVVMTEKC